MPGLTVTSAQLGTLLAEAGLRPGIGSPVHALAAAPLPDGHPDRDALVTMTALRTVPGAEPDVRPNRAVTAALRACTEPDEVLWIGTPAAGGSVNVCRRGRLYVDCSRRPDGRIAIVFPLDRAQVVLLAMAGLSGDRTEPASSGFACRGPLADVFVLRLVADVSADAPIAVSRIATELRSAVDAPDRTLAISSYGRRRDLDRLVDDPAALDAALDRLVVQSHLIREGTTVRLTAATAAVLRSPLEAAFGVGRRSITTVHGERRLGERQLRIERRGGRLVVERVVPEDGVPVVELVERTRAEVRSLVGVFLLGDEWDRVAA